jgi:ubiquinone/menaquinone biosynthesis C-methylase UbiE
VEDAARRAARRGCADRVSFRVGDGMANGLPDAAFDRVWVMESSHLMPRKDTLLAECARVLRPGGRMVLCDIILHRELPMKEVLSRARDFMHLHNAFGRAKMETLDTYERLAQQCGLRLTERLDISQQTLPTFAHWRRKLDQNSEAVRGLIGDGGLEHLQASCAILPQLWNDRILGYGLFVAVKE